MNKILAITILLLVLIVSGMFIYGEASAEVQSIIYKSGHITQNEVWTSNNIYVIQDHVTVDHGVYLIIQEGTIVKFAESKLMGVHGALRVGSITANENLAYLPFLLSKASHFLSEDTVPNPILNHSDLISETASLKVYFTSIRDDRFFNSDL